jgi:hypothetical protein
MRSFVIALVLFTSFASVAAEKKPVTSECENNLIEADFSLGTTLKLFNFPRKNDYKMIDEGSSTALVSENQIVSSRARVLLLKTIYDNAETREAAMFFTLHYADLIPPPSLIYQASPRDDYRGFRLYEAIMRENVKELTLNLWYLTLLKLANSHPAIFFNDLKSVGAIAEQICWKNPQIQLSARLPHHKEFLIAYRDVHRLLEHARHELIFESFKHPLVMLEPMEAIWREAMQRGWQKGEVPQSDILEFAKKLKLGFKPPTRPRD